MMRQNASASEVELFGINDLIRGSQSWESMSILTSILALIPVSIFDQESTPESMFFGIDAELMFRFETR
jgi:hypothetical protein